MKNQFLHNQRFESNSLAKKRNQYLMDRNDFSMKHSYILRNQRTVASILLIAQVSNSPSHYCLKLFSNRNLELELTTPDSTDPTCSYPYYLYYDYSLHNFGSICYLLSIMPI